MSLDFWIQSSWGWGWDWYVLPPATTSVLWWVIPDWTSITVDWAWNISAVSTPVSNVVFSAEITWTNNWTFEFIHNLWLTQADVEFGRYKLTIISITANLIWRQYWDTYNDASYWWAFWWDIFQMNHDFTTNTPSDARSINHQTNSLKIKLWELGGNMVFRFLLKDLTETWFDPLTLA